MGKLHNLDVLLVLQPIQVDTGTDDREGRLVLANGLLVAVLVRLDDATHDAKIGGWFVEAAFGRLQGARIPPFDTLESATRWLRAQLKPNIVSS